MKRLSIDVACKSSNKLVLRAGRDSVVFAERLQSGREGEFFQAGRVATGHQKVQCTIEVDLLEVRADLHESQLLMRQLTKPMRCELDEECTDHRQRLNASWRIVST